MAFNWGNSNVNPGYGQWQNQGFPNIMPQGQGQQYPYGQGPMNVPQQGYMQNFGQPGNQFNMGQQVQYQQNMPMQQSFQQYSQAQIPVQQFHGPSGNFQSGRQQPQAQHKPPQQGRQQNSQQQQQQKHKHTPHPVEEHKNRLHEEIKKQQFEEQQRKLKEMSIMGSRGRSGSGKDMIEDMMSRTLTTSQGHKGSTKSNQPTTIFGKPRSASMQQENVNDDFSGFQSAGFQDPSTQQFGLSNSSMQPQFEQQSSPPNQYFNQLNQTSQQRQYQQQQQQQPLQQASQFQQQQNPFPQQNQQALQQHQQALQQYQQGLQQYQQALQQQNQQALQQQNQQNQFYQLQQQSQFSQQSQLPLQQQNQFQQQQNQFQQQQNQFPQQSQQVQQQQIQFQQQQQQPSQQPNQFSQFQAQQQQPLPPSQLSQQQPHQGEQPQNTYASDTSTSGVIATSFTQPIPVGMPYSSASARKTMSNEKMEAIKQSTSDDFGDFQSGSQFPTPVNTAAAQSSSPFPIGSLPLAGGSSNTFQEQGTKAQSPDAYSVFSQNMPSPTSVFGNFAAPMGSPTLDGPSSYPGQHGVATPPSSSAMQMYGNMESQGPSQQQEPQPEEEEKTPTDVDLYGCELPDWCHDKLSLPSVYVKVLERSQDKDGYINIYKLQPILMASSLAKEKLAEIWEMANKKTPGTLIEEELFLILALVALAQAGWNKLSVRKVASCRAPPIPELPDYLFMAKGEESVFAEESGTTPLEEDSVSSLPVDPNDRYSVFRVLDRQRSESVDDLSERRHSMLSTGSADSSSTGKDIHGVNRSSGSFSTISAEPEQDDWGTFTTCPQGSFDLSSSGSFQLSTSSVPTVAAVLEPIKSVTGSQSMVDFPTTSPLVPVLKPVSSAPILPLSGAPLQPVSSVLLLPVSGAPLLTASSAPHLPASTGITTSAPTTFNMMEPKVASGIPNDDFDDFTSFQSSSDLSVNTNSEILPALPNSDFTALGQVDSGVDKGETKGTDTWADFSSFPSTTAVLESSSKSDTKESGQSDSLVIGQSTGTSDYSSLVGLAVISDKASNLEQVEDKFNSLSVNQQTVSDSISSKASSLFQDELGTFEQAPAQNGPTSSIPGVTTSLESSLTNFGNISVQPTLTNDVKPSIDNKLSFSLGSKAASEHINTSRNPPIWKVEGSAELVTNSGQQETNAAEVKQNDDADFGDFSSFAGAPANGFHMNGIVANDIIKNSNSKNGPLSVTKDAVAPFSKPIDLHDRYSAFKADLQQEERHGAEWKRCLKSIVTTFSTAVGTIKRHKISEQAKMEVLSSQKGKDHFNSLKEIYAVNCRITASINNSALSKSDNELQILVTQIESLWNEIKRFMSISPSFVTPDHLDMSACRLTEGENDAQMCGVCLLSTQKENDNTKDWNLINTNFTYGGKAYHSACANFWCNKVNSVLPALPPISSGLL